jgi:hypothetical protein
MARMHALLAAALLCLAAPAQAQFVINEVLHDPPPGDDVNGDGTADTSQDEFIELVNNTNFTLMLDGWSITDAVAVRHVFPAGTIVPPFCGIIVFGGGAPAGSFGGMVTQTASSGFLGLNNAGDTVTLLNPANNPIDTMTYPSGVSDQSFTRDPDISGAFVAHTTATGSGGAVHSPGTLVDGSLFTGCQPTPVNESTWGRIKTMYR